MILPFTNKSMTRDENSMLVDPSAGSPPRTKFPYHTEWNHCYPNQYAYESPLLFGL